MSQFVIGLGFGDEGKGLVTSYLTSKAKNPLVIRFNGGHQAGHTVMYKTNSHVFSSFGSGTLQGATTYWSQFCTFYPLAFLNEYDALRQMGLTPKVIVNAECPITTPFDVAANRADYTNGSVGVGFGKTVERDEGYYKLRVRDFYVYDKILRAKLFNIAKFYYKWDDDGYIEKIIEQFIEQIVKVKSLIEVGKRPNLTPDQPIKRWYSDVETIYYDRIYEGAQGILLDMDYGFFPNVTRSNTTTKNAIIVDDGIGSGDEVFYVTRSYQTRHGKGFMTNEEHAHLLQLQNTALETNISHPFQGEFRKTILDIDLLNYALTCDGYHTPDRADKNLVITCLDQTGDVFYATEGGQLISIDALQLVTKLNVTFKKVFISRNPLSLLEQIA